MLDFSRVIGFDWDDGNRAKNRAHAVENRETEQLFFNAPLKVTRDESHSVSESRFRALDRTDEGRLLTVIFTLRADGTLIRVISARDMHRKERILYEQAP